VRRNEGHEVCGRYVLMLTRRMGIEFLAMAHGFVYLRAIAEVASRKVLSLRRSHTMMSAFCVEALEEALTMFGRPEIFNTDQSSQLTT
jgi:putative transposase